MFKTNLLSFPRVSTSVDNAPRSLPVDKEHVDHTLHEDHVGHLKELEGEGGGEQSQPVLQLRRRGVDEVHHALTLETVTHVCRHMDVVKRFSSEDQSFLGLQVK